MLATSRIHLLAVLIAILFGLAFTWTRLAGTLQPSRIERADFVQFYEMAARIRAGVPVYERPLNVVGYVHPPGYPPPAAFFALPLIGLSYRNAFVAWSIFETLCFTLSAILILSQLEPRNRLAALAIVAVFTFWWPFFAELYQGQMMMLALLLLTCTWIGLRHDKSIMAGFPLGVLLALKFYGWPLVVFLVLRKNFRAVAVTVATFTLINLFAIVVVGLDQALLYLENIAPVISQMFRSHPLNFSAFSIGATYFGVAGGIALAGLILIAALYFAMRSPTVDHAFAIMLIACTVLSPVAWVRYFVTLLPAACVTLQKASARSLIIVGALALLSVADSRLITEFMSPAIARVCPLLFTVGLMVVAHRLNTQHSVR